MSSTLRSCWRVDGANRSPIRSSCLHFFALSDPAFLHCAVVSLIISHLLVSLSFIPLQGWAGMTFGHLGTGTGMAQPIPKLWEREREWKISFPTFGNGNGKIPFPIFGNGNGNSIPAFREREWDVVIPGNDREWERELHRKIEWKFFIIPLFNPTNILHCNRPQICS